MKTPATAAVWQRRIRLARVYSTAAARIALAAAVLAGCILADSAVLAYELGRQTGAAVHGRNDQLAALAVRLLAPEPAPVAPETLPEQIRRMAANGASQRSIASALGVTRYTVQKALRATPTT